MKRAEYGGMTRRNQIKAFVDELGRPAVMEQLGLTSPSAITNAIRQEKLPAHWYVGMRELAEARGLECDPELFGFKRVAA